MKELKDGLTKSLRDRGENQQIIYDFIDFSDLKNKIRDAKIVEFDGNLNGILEYIESTDGN